MLFIVCSVGKSTACAGPTQQSVCKILPWSDRVTRDLKTVAIAPCLFERTEQLEFIDTHRTKAVRRYDLNFQIPCFDGRELELLIGFFEKPDVLRLKLAD